MLNFLHIFGRVLIGTRCKDTIFCSYCKVYIPNITQIW